MGMRLVLEAHNLASAIRHLKKDDPTFSAFTEEESREKLIRRVEHKLQDLTIDEVDARHVIEPIWRGMVVQVLQGNDADLEPDQRIVQFLVNSYRPSDCV